jgi:preprotein translocase subunit YajC
VGSGFLIVLLAMFGFMWFLLIRPQRAQARKHAEMLGGLKPGDEVVTSGGIYGEVVQLDEERVMLEIDDDVKVAVARRAITTIVPPEELQRLEAAEDADEADGAEETDATGDGVTVEEPLTAEERTSSR